MHADERKPAATPAASTTPTTTKPAATTAASTKPTTTRPAATPAAPTKRTITSFPVIQQLAMWTHYF